MNIKEYRENELKTFVIVNILVILCLNETITFNGVLENNNYMQLLITIITSGLFSSIIYAMVTVCNCLISSNIKKIIVFWWFPMPGETIFSDIKIDTKDNRFTNIEAIESYGDIYDNMPSDSKVRQKYENSKWYYLFRQHETETKVMIAHKDYLMCRDMATLSIIMVIVYVILSIILELITFEITVIKYLLGVYLVCMFAARVKSKRFVKTVIACNIHLKNKIKENEN